MALNINYQGNVVDENGDPIECKYMAFSHNISTWGDIRDTEAQQYNINFGDGDLNTQSGSVSVGDAILILFWQDAPTKDELLTRFSVMSFIYDGSDNVVQNVQLLPPVTPSCAFSLSAFGLVGENVHVTSYASIIHQWTFESKIHYHRRNWYGQTIFGFLDVLRDQFNFSGSYGDIIDHTYTNSGDFVVIHQVENTYGLSSECQKEIRVKYRSPVGGLSFLQGLPLVGATIDIVASIQDIDSRITSIDHIFDNNVLHSNTTLNYQYSTVLAQYGEYDAKQSISWNDGFDDNVLDYAKRLSMGNNPPVVDISILPVSGTDGLFKAELVVSDVDGTVVDACWSLFYEGEANGLPHPYFRCIDQIDLEYNKIYSFCDISTTELDLLFAIPGNYRIEVVATDNLGATGNDSIDFSVEDVCNGIITPCEDCPECPECPDCPDCEECPDCPDCPEIDCQKEINIAVRELKLKLLEEMDKNNRTIVVQDSRVSGNIASTLSERMEGDIQEGGIAGEMSGRMGGRVSTSKTSSSIGGKIDGKIKKG